jgi:hypothetical protein
MLRTVSFCWLAARDFGEKAFLEIATEIVQSAIVERHTLFGEHQLNAFIMDATALRRQADLAVEDLRNWFVEFGRIGIVVKRCQCTSRIGTTVILNRAEFPCQLPGLTLATSPILNRIGLYGPTTGISPCDTVAKNLVQSAIASGRHENKK